MAEEEDSTSALAYLEWPSDFLLMRKVPYAPEQMTKLLDSLKYMEHTLKMFVKSSNFWVLSWEIGKVSDSLLKVLNVLESLG